MIWTSAPGITPPEESSTIPEIAPVGPLCPKEGVAKQKMSAAMSNKRFVMVCLVGVNT